MSQVLNVSKDLIIYEGGETKIGTCAIIRRNGKYLLGKRSAINSKGLPRKGAGSWGLMGGKCDVGETPRAAIIREVLEECGLIVYACTFLGNYFDGEYDDYAFAVQVKDSSHLIPAEGEVDEIGWFSLNEMKSMEIFEATQLSLDLLIKYGLIKE